MEIEFLGTGTSTGVPQIGCGCEVCRSRDPRDKRFRASAIVRTHGKAILIDCGPDFRSQILNASNHHLDALIVTHTHYDHVGGVDDLRPYCYHRTPRFPIYARREVLTDLYRKMPYSFSDNPYPGAPIFDTFEIDAEPFECCGIKVVPLPVWHGNLLINGYRMGDLAYITDAKFIPEQTLELIKGVKVLVVNALRYEEHASHMSVDAALHVVGLVKPKRAYFTHMCHQIGLHSVVNRRLPDGVELAYDGEIVKI
ncbi:MAG: MBL fold metallo-hydrolase [Muribaculaceae bacterium]